MGNWTGTQLRPQRSVQIVEEGAQAASAAGLGIVHLIDENDARHVGFFSESPHALGDGLDAGLGVDDYDGGFDGKERGAGFVGEHVEAGRVDEVDFDALPLGKGDGVLHGDAAGHFLFVVGGGGRAVFHAALGGSHLRGMQQSGNKGGFAAVCMPHYSYVADLTSLVRFHGVLLGCDGVRVQVRAWTPARQPVWRPALYKRDGLRKDCGRDLGATPVVASEGPSWRDRAPGLASSSSIRKSQAVRGESEGDFRRTHRQKPDAITRGV